jgi:hypothetical protein
MEIGREGEKAVGRQAGKEDGKEGGTEVSR